PKWHAGNGAGNRGGDAAGPAPGAALHQIHPRTQYTSRPTYSLIMDRLAARARKLGCQNEKPGSLGTTICGAAGAAIGSMPCLRNTATARGMCRADVTNRMRSIWRRFSSSAVYTAFSRVVR